MVSHGMCDQRECKSSYLAYSLGCTIEDALSILEEMLKEQN